MTLYRISILPGFEPLVLDKSVQGFIEARNREEAIAQFIELDGRELPVSRVAAEPRSAVGASWERDRDNFAVLNGGKE